MCFPQILLQHNESLNYNFAYGQEGLHVPRRTEDTA